MIEEKNIPLFSFNVDKTLLFPDPMGRKIDIKIIYGILNDYWNSMTALEKMIAQK